MEVPVGCRVFDRRILSLSVLFVSSAISIRAQTTDFTYQGRLASGGTPANGQYDLEFSLYKEPDAGSPLETLTRPDVTLIGGLFTVQLGFSGGLFDGGERFLE